jgi:hypothetical protein
VKSTLLGRLLIFAAWIFCSSVFAAAKSSREEWIFHQTSPQFGNQDIYVCHDAIKIVNSRYNFEIVANAPTWKLHAFRRANKTMCVVDKIDLEDAMPLSRVPKPGSFFLEGEQTWQGLACKKFKESNGASTLTTNMVKTDPRANSVLCNYYNVPKFSDFPVCNFWNRKEHTNYTRKDWADMSQFKDITDSSTFKFATRSWQKVAYSANDFVYPSDYRLTADVKEIVLGEHKKQLESLIDDLGFTSDSMKEMTKANESAKRTPSK